MIIIQLVMLITIVAIIVCLVKAVPKSNCTGDCNQGRNCTCQNNK